MDEPDYPMLDVGDFEVLDECVGEDDDDEVISYDGGNGEHIDEDDGNQPEEQPNDYLHVDENSGDNADNILDVSIDFEENEFLENVAKDFSENIEEAAEQHPRITRSSSKRREPCVQLQKLDMSIAKSKTEPEVSAAPRKKPGPKSKTMNVPAPPPKRSIQKITFSDKSKKEDDTEKQKNSSAESQKNPIKDSEKNDCTLPQKDSNLPSEKNLNTETQKNSNASPTKKTNESKPNVPAKKSVFLKADLTDEEIMMHFDEIENTVLTSDTFVIQEEVDQAAKEKSKFEDINCQPPKIEEIEEQNKNDIAEEEEEENWDKESSPPKKKSHIQVEQEEFKESEMWYKEKLKQKQESVEIKFSKLAGMINYSFPCYKKWLDRNDVLYGTAICKVEPSKHVPLDHMHHNRWKFVCNKKQNLQSAKEKENQDNTTSSENAPWTWSVVPGVPDAKLDDTEEYPPFVMRAVKFFEDFLNTLESENYENTKEESKDETSTSEEKDKQPEPETSEEVQEVKENDEKNDKKKICIPPDGFVILLRCNRKEEIMMNITGKNVSQEFKDRCRDYFENGPGKESNVKSFYCKSIIKENNVISTESVLLCGSETLDDTIGSIKINLPPKANMWANLAGVEVLAHTTIEFLLPTPNTTVLEIGCGTGVMSLLLASKCLKVIGVDIEKEVSEAQTLCNLNGIKNAIFLTGKPEIFLKDIEKSLEDSKTVAVVNMNSVFGRSIKVIKGLRRITTLGRIVIITTLSKQATRSILELVQPAHPLYGNPFVPIRACLVDTTPKHFGYEIVMSMERRTMRNLLKVPPIEGASTSVGLISKSKQEALKKNSESTQAAPYKKGVPTKIARGGYTSAGKKFVPNPHYKGADKLGSKRPYSEDDDTFQSGFKKYKSFEKPWLGSNTRPNPMHDKKLRGSDEEDLRTRLSSNRLEPSVIVNEITEQKKILDAAKEKLTGASATVDTETVKKLQEMLNLAIEKTNKLQSQLPPRSVWDRIAPPEGSKDESKGKSDDRSPPIRGGRLIKETGPKEIIITTSNNRAYGSSVPVPPGKSKKYGNVPPVEPILLEPVGGKSQKTSHPASQKPSSAPYHKPGPNRFTESSYRKPSDNWDKGKPPSYKEPPGRYSKSSPPRRPLTPPRQSNRPGPRQASPPRRPMSPPVRRPLLSPPRRPASPPRRASSPPRRPISPPRRPVSPGFRQHSTSSRNVPNSNRQNSPPRRFSPPRRPFSPPTNRISPPRQKPPMQYEFSKKPSPPRRYADEWDIPTRGAVNEGGWRPEKEKSGWHGAPSTSSNWDQTNNINGNRYRPENSNWDKPSVGGPWNGPPNNAGSNWDVKKDVPRDMGRHEPRIEPRFELRHEPPRRPISPLRHEPPRMEPRHEPPRRPLSPPRHEPRHELPRRPISPPRRETRHEPPRRPLSPPRHEPRHEPPRRPMSPPRHEPRHEPARHESRPEARHEPRWEPAEKDDFDLPEDARDPWGDDPHPVNTTKDVRWVPPAQQNPTNQWGREQQNESNWSAKPNFPMNNMGGGGGGGPNMQNPNMNMGMGMNMGMNNQKQSAWQPPVQQQQQQNRNTNWLPPGNWQGSGIPNNQGGAIPTNQGVNMVPNVMNNWQQPQQNFNNFNARPFNNNPFMNNRR